MLKLEAIKVGACGPAPLLTLIVGPSDATKAVGKAKQEFAARYDIRLGHWTKLLEHAKSRTRLHAGISPGRYSWVGTGAGKAGLTFNYVAWEQEAAAELYIDRGKGADAEKKLIFEKLLGNKQP